MKNLILKGELVTADFEEKTMTFEIENDMVIQAGNYTILKTEDYEKQGGVSGLLPDYQIEEMQDLLRLTINIWYKENKHGDSSYWRRIKKLNKYLKILLAQKK